VQGYRLPFFLFADVSGNKVFFYLWMQIYDMVEDIQAIFNKKIKPVKFKRTIGLFGATTIGVGSLLGAGIYVLIGSAANVAGPSVVFSYLLCGLLAFVTTIMYADLSRLIPRSGGGYTYAYSLLGSLGGFSTGWFLALGSILASSLYAIGFAEYAVSFTGNHASGAVTKAIAIGITLLITGFNLLPKRDGKFNFQNWIVWGNVAILLVLIILSSFHLDVENATPVFPKGFSGMLGALSIIYISFFGYQLIANNADEIKEPEKTIPKAMKLSMLISMAIYLLVAVAAVLSVSWTKLATSPAPLVIVANESFGGSGWLIISFGGVLASLGALSSTLLSQSRQAYTMGKDRFFPDMFGKLNEKTKQPAGAVLAGGILTSLALAAFELETIAKVTNLSLLLSLLPVSLALRKLYKENPAVRPKSVFKRLLPEISLAINLGLLLTMDLFALALGQQLIIAGVLIYFFYSRKREKSGREGRNIVLEEGTSFSFFRKNKILVPVSNPETQNALLRLSHILMSKKGGDIIVIAIKDVPAGKDLYEALSDDKGTLNVIRKSIEVGEKNNIKFKPVIRASRNIALGIVHAAEEEGCDLIVMGFPQKMEHYKDSIFTRVIKESHTDLIFINFRVQPEDFVPRVIGVYVKDHRNLSLLLMTATAIAEQLATRLIIFSYLPKGYSRQQKNKADKLLISSLEELRTTALYSAELFVSDDPVDDVIERSSGFDALIIGKDLRNPNKTLDELPSFRIARGAKCSVIMVKKSSRLEHLKHNI
jgi:amino acid transporter/nucleotide-binding universal stress UspA family protein